MTSIVTQCSSIVGKQERMNKSQIWRYSFRTQSLVLCVAMSLGLMLSQRASASIEMGKNQGQGGAVRINCDSTKGAFNIDVYPAWSPIGAQRFLDLVKDDFWNGVTFYRVLPGFLVQFGIAADPAKQKKWKEKGTIKDDPQQGIGFQRGMISFAGGGTNSRSSDIFITYADSDHLGKMPWETPFARVVSGMPAIDSLYSGYGDFAAFGGHAPDWGKMLEFGEHYLRKEYPELDYIKFCKVDDRRLRRPTPNPIDQHIGNADSIKRANALEQVTVQDKLDGAIARDGGSEGKNAPDNIILGKASAVLPTLKKSDSHQALSPRSELAENTVDFAEASIYDMVHGHEPLQKVNLLASRGAQMLHNANMVPANTVLWLLPLGAVVGLFIWWKRATSISSSSRNRPFKQHRLLD